MLFHGWDSLVLWFWQSGVTNERFHPQYSVISKLSSILLYLFTSQWKRLHGKKEFSPHDRIYFNENWKETNICCYCIIISKGRIIIFYLLKMQYMTWNILLSGNRSYRSWWFGAVTKTYFIFKCINFFTLNTNGAYYSYWYIVLIYSSLNSIFFEQKFEWTKHKISIVSKGNKKSTYSNMNSNMLLSQSCSDDTNIKLLAIFNVPSPAK